MEDGNGGPAEGGGGEGGAYGSWNLAMKPGGSWVDVETTSKSCRPECLF